MSNNSIFGNFLWKFAERVSAQGVSFVISIVLARLLLPEQYGVISMIQIFIILANCFIVSGFSTSLIQKKDADDLDFSTILYCSLGVAVVLYVTIYFLSPAIATFYNEPILTQVTRVYSFTLVISAYNSVQQAWVSRNMKFKLFFYSTLIGNVLSGIIGIFLALRGWGVWALVIQTLSSQIINTLVLACLIDWHPQFKFSQQRAKPLMSYGWKILGSDLISVIYFQSRKLLIGKFYTASDLAYYDRGNTIPETVAANFDASLGQVLFPALSNYSDSPHKVKELSRRALKVTSFTLFFVMTTLLIVAEPLIRVLLTERWIDCVPFFQLVCIAKMLQSISNANLQSFKAVGRSDVVLRLELIKKPVGFLLILLSFKISVLALAITVPLYGLYSAFVNMSSNKKVLGYTVKEQLSDLRPAFILSLSMYVVLYVFSLLFIETMPDFIVLVLDVIVCFAYYFVVAKISKVEACEYCINIIKTFVTKKH